jgi:hypothetical protein
MYLLMVYISTLSIPHNKMISEQCIGKDVEGRDCSLI